MSIPVRNEQATTEPLTREERHRKRVRALAVEIKRVFLTGVKACERFIAEEDADDAGVVAIFPGHSAELPQRGKRPPPGMIDTDPPEAIPSDPMDDPAFRAADRLMRQAPDPNGRFDRS